MASYAFTNGWSKPSGVFGLAKLEKPAKLRLLVVDDHEVVRDGLFQFLADSTTDVVAAAGSAVEAVQMLDSVRPDAVLMDVRMDEFDGLWGLEKIKAVSPQLPVVLFSSYDNPTYMARAIALGASDYLLKNSSRATILASIRRSFENRPATADSLLEKIRNRLAATKQLPPRLVEFALTQREVQVLRHIGLGLSNKEIAKSLSISVETVKEHVQNILRKTKAADRTDVAVKAVRWGLVD